MEDYGHAGTGEWVGGGGAARLGTGMGGRKWTEIFFFFHQRIQLKGNKKHNKKNK